MKKILALALFAVALVSCRQTMQTDGFKLSGHLEGLQVGDTLFLKTFLLPDWKEDGTDTILVEKEGIFSAFIPMEHTTFYLLTSVILHDEVPTYLFSLQEMTLSEYHL